MDDASDFKKLFKNYLIEHSQQFIKTGSISQQQRLVVEKNKVSYRIEESIKTEILPFKMMGYQAFITDQGKSALKFVYKYSPKWQFLEGASEDFLMEYYQLFLLDVNQRSRTLRDPYYTCSVTG